MKTIEDLKAVLKLEAQARAAELRKELARRDGLLQALMLATTNPVEQPCTAASIDKWEQRELEEIDRVLEPVDRSRAR